MRAVQQSTQVNVTISLTIQRANANQVSLDALPLVSLTWLIMLIWDM